jgi:predicted RNA-binding Zn ribbon-like protein
MAGSPDEIAPEPTRKCFVVSAFGETVDDQRRYKQVLRHLIRKVLGSRFEVVRADEIDDEGLITHQIIEHLLEDDLVVADLTDLNPNVFYEVAVRHAVQKPIVHLITVGQEIPFDIANMRAVSYALDDPDLLQDAQEELARKVEAIEEADWVAAPNPISAARKVSLLQESEQPDIRAAGDVLAALGELRDEVRTLTKRASTAEPRTKTPMRERVMRYLVHEGEAVAIPDIAEQIGVPMAAVAGALSVLRQEGRAEKTPAGDWAVSSYQPPLLQ